MSKVIAIGQACLDILHEEGKGVTSFVGGRIANMAVMLSRKGVEVEYVSECAVDGVGDMIVKHFADNGVGTKSIDRYTEGLSQVSMIFRDAQGNERFSQYVKYPDTRFDVLWPTIEENDVVVFGSFFSIEENVRRPLTELLAYAIERKAIIVYLPGFQPELCSRITRVMPYIVENLEVADIVIARESDMKKIYNQSDASQCFNNNIRFYTDNFLYEDSRGNATLFARNYSQTFASRREKPKAKLLWDAAMVAGFISGMISGGITRQGLSQISAEAWSRVMKETTEFYDNLQY